MLSGKCFLFVPRVLHRVEFSHIVPERPTGTDYYAPAGCTPPTSFFIVIGLQRVSVTALLGLQTVTRNRASGNVGPADCDWCYHENRSRPRSDDRGNDSTR